MDTPMPESGPNRHRSSNAYAHTYTHFSMFVRVYVKQPYGRRARPTNEAGLLWCYTQRCEAAGKLIFWSLSSAVRGPVGRITYFPFTNRLAFSPCLVASLDVRTFGYFITTKKRFQTHGQPGEAVVGSQIGWHEGVGNRGETALLSGTN